MEKVISKALSDADNTHDSLCIIIKTSERGNI